jgi:hypothetical protein
MKINALVFGGSQSKSRYIPGIGNKSSIYVGQPTYSGGKIMAIELDPTGQFVAIRCETKDRKTQTEWDKTSDSHMLTGDTLGIPVGAATLVYDAPKPQQGPNQQQQQAQQQQRR